MAKTDPSARLLRLINYAEPRIARQIVTVVNLLRDKFTLEEITSLLERGPEEFFREVSRVSGVMASNIAAVSYIRAGDDTSKWLTDNLADLFDFNSTNTRAVNAVRQNRFRLINAFTQVQRDAVQTAITEGVRQGLNPREQARLFRDSIGLTSRQTQAVSRFRELLQAGDRDVLTRQLRDRRFDPTVRRAIDDGRELTQRQIDTMVDRYRERYVKYRSEAIARTEALRGVHEGAEEMYRQAIEGGQLDPDSLTRTWETSGDSRVRDSHGSMSGQKRRMGEPFTSGNGYNLMYPGDLNAPASETVQCRCIVTTRIS